MEDLITNPAFYFAYATLQAMVVVALIRYLDFHDRQPMFVVAVVAAWGATGAAGLSLIGNDVLARFLTGDVRVVFGNAIAPPLVEEAAKGLALIAAWGPIRWLGRRAGITVFGGVGAGIVYGAAVGVGFSFTEDIWFLFNSATNEGLEVGIDLYLHRRDFFGPAVLHHSVFTAAFGAGLGLASWRRRGLREVVYPLLGFLVAVTLHAANNGLVQLVLVLQHGVGETAAWVGGGAPHLDATATTIQRVMRVVDFYYFVAFLGAVLLWGRYQRRIVLAELEEEVSTGLLTEQSLAELFGRGSGGRLLVRGRLEQWHHHGKLRAELSRLGLLKWRTRRFDEDWSRVQRARRHIASLATYDVAPMRLPAARSSLIGREVEVDELSTLLSDRAVRLVTMTGPGGTGKTRLALDVAERIGPRFASGVWFVELAPVSDPALVAATIAQSLEVPEVPGRSALDSLADFLRDKQSLLVLDNFEQVAEAGTAVAELLQAASRVKLLLTSRQPLHVAGEHEYPVPPLALPSTDEPDLVTAIESPAVALFVQRAMAAVPSFTIDEQNVGAITRICAGLDGLPLAIELAAVRTKVLSPTEILERLGRSLEVLTVGASDVPARHRTLRGAIDWSHGLLGTDEQAVFARLAVFVDGATLDAIERVCVSEDGDADGVVDAVGSLLDESLLRRVEGRDGRTRFMMLATIREYAVERLEERDEASALRRRHARWVMELAEHAEFELQGPEQATWVERLDVEAGNLRAALAWSLESGDLAVGMRIAGALPRFWSMRGFTEEVLHWLDVALSQDVEVPVHARARALYAAGYASFEDDHAAGQRRFEESIELYRQLDNTRGVARSLAQLSVICVLRGDFEAATPLAEEAAALARTVPDLPVESVALSALAEGRAHEGDYGGADELYRRSLELRRAGDDRRTIANALLNLGRNDVLRGELKSARLHLTEGWTLASEVHDDWSVAVGLTRLGWLEARCGDAAEARGLLTRALERWVERGQPDGAAETLDILAEVADREGDPHQVARLTGVAQGLRGNRVLPLPPTERAVRDELAARTRDDLGTEVWEQERAAAGDVRLDEVRAWVEADGGKRT